MTPDAKAASRSHASLSVHRCTPPHAGQAIGEVMAMWLKSATSHLIPVGTAVSAVGHRTITMYGCFGTAQSLRVQKRARSAAPAMRPVNSPSTKPIVTAIAVAIPMRRMSTTPSICTPFVCVALSAHCCIASTSCDRKRESCVGQATEVDMPRQSAGANGAYFVLGARVAFSPSPSPHPCCRWVHEHRQTCRSTRSGDQADSFAWPPLQKDIFCFSSDDEVTKPNAAPVVNGLAVRGLRSRWERRESPFLVLVSPWLIAICGTPLQISGFGLRSIRRLFASAEVPDITLPLSWIRWPMG